MKKKLKFVFHHGEIALELPPYSLSEAIFPEHLTSISELMKYLGYKIGDIWEISKNNNL